MSATSSTYNEFADRDTLREALLMEFKNVISDAIAQRGEAVIALSGGSTPIPLYQAVASLPFDWHKVCFALVDERWLETSHSGSNECQLRKALAPALEAGAGFVGMYSENCTLTEGEALCETRYQGLSLPFDLLLQIPIIKANRYPSRYSVIIMLCFAILVAWGTAALLTAWRIKKERTQIFIVTGLALLLLF